MSAITAVEAAFSRIGDHVRAELDAIRPELAAAVPLAESALVAAARAAEPSLPAGLIAEVIAMLGHFAAEPSVQHARAIEDQSPAVVAASAGQALAAAGIPAAPPPVPGVIPNPV